jgi:hypothetical protein
MANHCWNYAYFTGDSKKLKQLYLSTIKLKEGDSHFISLYARNFPLILSDIPLKTSQGSLDVYDVYGSKWFECDLDKEEKDGEITSVTMAGDSAWSPMLPLFTKICKKLDLCCEGHYEESGMNFAGEFVITKNHYEDNMTSYRAFFATSSPEAYLEDLYNEIEEGYYQTFEDLLEELEETKFQPTAEERERMAHLLNDYKQAKEEALKKIEESKNSENSENFEQLDK